MKWSSPRDRAPSNRREQIHAVAESVAKAGAKILRAGAFKPRTSPYAFQGMGEEGLKLMREAADKFDLVHRQRSHGPFADPDDVGYVDIFQVGARNMQNYHLLRALGEVRKPVLLKRGMSATMEELLLSAEYILAGGNLRRDFVRARHPHLRNLHPQHVRYRRDSGHQKTFAPADDRPILRTAPGAATKLRPWLAPPWPPAPTVC